MEDKTKSDVICFKIKNKGWCAETGFQLHNRSLRIDLTEDLFSAAAAGVCRKDAEGRMGGGYISSEWKRRGKESNKGKEKSASLYPMIYTLKK